MFPQIVFQLQHGLLMEKKVNRTPFLPNSIHMRHARQLSGAWLQVAWRQQLLFALVLVLVDSGDVQLVEEVFSSLLSIMEILTDGTELDVEITVEYRYQFWFSPCVINFQRITKLIIIINGNRKRHDRLLSSLLSAQSLFGLPIVVFYFLYGIGVPRPRRHYSYPLCFAVLRVW